MQKNLVPRKERRKDEEYGARCRVRKRLVFLTPRLAEAQSASRAATRSIYCITSASQVHHKAKRIGAVERSFIEGFITVLNREVDQIAQVFIFSLLCVQRRRHPAFGF